MRIDVHAHHYARELAERMQRLDADGVKEGWFPHTRDVPFERRLELMAEAGVDAQVLSPGSSQPYFARPEAAADAATAINDCYKAIVDRYPGQFAAFGCVPLPHLDRALAEASRCLDELGCVGISLGCSVARRPLDDPAFEPFWAELERRQTTVFLHPMGIGAPLTDEFNLTWMVGGCYEDTTAALRLVASGLTARYPHVKFIVPHLGGTIPFLWGRLQSVPGPDREQRTVELRRLYYDTVNNSAAALRCACEAVGAAQLVFGTDFPYPPGPKRFADLVQQAGLAADEVAAIMGGTAQALLRLPRDQ